jgi:exosortase
VSAVLFSLIVGVLIYFFGFYKVFMNGAQSTAEWAWAGWNDENDQVHCRFILPIIGFLLWNRRADLMAVVKAPSARGMAFIISGVLLFVLAVRCLQPRIAIVSAPLIVYGVAEYLGGRAFARTFIFPCLLMLFMVPIGGVIQGTVTLQLLASKTVGALCGVLGIHVQIIGTTINVDGHPFEVAGGCSGIRSLMAMTMLAALYVYFSLRHPWQQFVVFAGSIVFALIGNIARLFTVVLVAKWWDPQIAGGLYHDYSGFVFFPIAVLAMVGFGNLVSHDWSHARSRIARTLTAKDAEAPPKTDDGGDGERKPTSPISYDY